MDINEKPKNKQRKTKKKLETENKEKQRTNNENQRMGVSAARKGPEGIPKRFRWGPKNIFFLTTILITILQKKGPQRGTLLVVP